MPLSGQADTTGGLRGYIFHADHRGVKPEPLRGAIVIVYSLNYGVRRLATDKRGFFVLLGLPPGKYVVAVGSDGDNASDGSVGRCVDAGFIRDATITVYDRGIHIDYSWGENHKPTPETYAGFTSFQDDCGDYG